MVDEANAWGFTAENGAYVNELSDGMLEAVTEHLALKNSPMLVVLFIGSMGPTVG